ncbi:MAG: glycosyltransferase [bacterium]
MFKATLIISIYKNIAALNVILLALQRQTEKAFEVIISEDGNNLDVQGFIEQHPWQDPNRQHLTQEDEGFRKNKALNQAIKHARTDYLIFIDGDCVPHHRFVESHVRSATPGFVCSGRRAELGPRLSNMIIKNPKVLPFFASLIGLLLYAPWAYFDGAKNYEAGLHSKFLHTFTQNRPRGIVGCNFSCYKKDLVAINGFNEDYVFPGDGEDSDIEWRLLKRDLRVRNIKFLAPLYHLYHKTKYQPSAQNKAILKKTMERQEVICINGLQKRGNSGV